jgi:catechol 2,3-dioxygenase-like lactoylglutathione lyase family enzyme
MGIRLNQFNLVVRDMAASVAFYRLLGLDIPDPEPEWSAWSDRHRSVAGSEFALDLDSEEFAREWDTGWVDRPGRMGVLGFHLDSSAEVDELYGAVVAAGYVGEQEPYDAAWGSRYAVVQDPDGNPVGLMGPRSTR